MVRLIVRRGCPIAQLVCVHPHIQMLCPHGSGPGLESDLWPFAACLPPYNSPRRSSVEEHRSRRTGKQSRKALDVPVDESTKT